MNLFIDMTTKWVFVLFIWTLWIFDKIRFNIIMLLTVALRIAFYDVKSYSINPPQNMWNKIFISSLAPHSYEMLQLKHKKWFQFIFGSFIWLDSIMWTNVWQGIQFNPKLYHVWCPVRKGWREPFIHLSIVFSLFLRVTWNRMMKKWLTFST